MKIGASSEGGRVYIVGAGPGDPGMITVRGVECLQQADVVLYDYLVNPLVLRHCRSGVPTICLGQHARANRWSAPAIDEAMVQYAQQGNQVVRLKGGDPVVFGRMAEELQALRKAGIPYEIVPGITAVLALGSLTEVPLTQRDEASALAIVTGQENLEKGETLDFGALARFPGTLAIYMGVTTAPRWTAELMAAGKAPDTPCMIVRRCSWPDQVTVRCPLHEVVQHLSPRSKCPPPALVLIGSVVAQAPDVGWFAARSLMGQGVLVTRPAGQMDALADRLRDQGAEVFEQPAIQIGPPASLNDLDACLDRLDEYDWIVWSSVNGVDRFFQRLWERGHDARRLARARLAVIGPGTAAALGRYGLRPDVSPSEFRAESLATALQPLVVGQNVLLVRASRGREVLADQLARSGANVQQVVAYLSSDVEQLESAVQDAWDNHRIHWVTVTSSAIARSLHRLLGDRLKGVKIASLSPVTSETLRELGYEPHAEATVYTMPGLVAAIQQALSLQDRQ